MGHVPARREEQMAVVVRVTVEDDDRRAGGTADEVPLLGRRRGSGHVAAEEAAPIGAGLPVLVLVGLRLGGRRFIACDVTDSPGSPELVEAQGDSAREDRTEIQMKPV